eukprot:COSAG01_NODE_6221_length_3782_cov_375.524029_5_plen_67_part_00
MGRAVLIRWYPVLSPPKSLTGMPSNEYWLSDTVQLETRSVVDVLVMVVFTVQAFILSITYAASLSH